jgi:hypothetical protein
MPKVTLTIDGEQFSTLDEFYEEVSRKLIPGAEWGHNLMRSTTFFGVALVHLRRGSFLSGVHLSRPGSGWVTPRRFAS